MKQKLFFAVCLLSVTFSYGQSNFQQTQSTQTPPNCNCSGFPQPQQLFGSSSNNMPPPAFCGTDGVNYTDPCSFINAQARNQQLGSRPCGGGPGPGFGPGPMMFNSQGSSSNQQFPSFSQPSSNQQFNGFNQMSSNQQFPSFSQQSSTSNQQFTGFNQQSFGQNGFGGMNGPPGMMGMGGMGPGGMGFMGPGGQQFTGFCMTDGTFLTSFSAVQQALQNNLTLGIRAKGNSSPCTLQCPPSPPMGFGMGMMGFPGSMNGNGVMTNMNGNSFSGSMTPLTRSAGK